MSLTIPSKQPPATRFSALLGKRVEVVYRLGAVYLLVVGKLLADSGDCLFLEQNFNQHGSAKTLHLKIPYHSIIRLNKSDPNSELALL